VSHTFSRHLRLQPVGSQSPAIGAQEAPARYAPRKILTARGLCRALPLLACLVLGGCHRGPGVSALALEECDPAGYIPCIQQSAFASIPITDTGLSLTYTSSPVAESAERQAWDATSLGLGGWSLNVLQRYDPKTRTLISGDGSWRLTDSAKLPSGERAVPSYDGALAYVFDSAGRHVRTVDGHLGTALLTITYDSAGRLTSLDGFIAGQPVHVSVQRDADAKPRSLAGIDGAVTNLESDGSGRLVTVTDPAGNYTRIEWEPHGQVSALTDPAGGTMRFSYDNTGLLATRTDADGVAQQFQRNSLSKGLEIAASTALGRRWAYRVEAAQSAGIRRTFAAADGTTSTQTTDTKGARSIQFADGTSLNVGLIANPIWGMAAPLQTPIVQKRPDGVSSRMDVKFALQAQRNLPYLLAGSVSTIINGSSWVEAFDPDKRILTVTDPAGRRSTNAYDDHGRLLNRSTPGAPSVSYSYDNQGRVLSKTIGSGSLAGITRYSYDSNLGQINTTQPNGTIQKVSVDRSGRVVSASSGDGSTAVIANDAAGQMRLLQPPGGFPFALGSSPAGRPTAFAPPIVADDGSIETTSYDADGRVVSILGLGQRSVAFTYDHAGRLANWKFDQGTGSATYDSRSGLRVSAAEPGGVDTTYGYAGSTPQRLEWSGPVKGFVADKLDANGRLASETLNDANNLNFAYDPAGQLVGIGPLTFTRDAESGLVTHSKLDAVETSQQFDANARLAHFTASAAGKVVLDQTYTRDPLGQITTISERTANGKASTSQYSYDSAGRLASVSINGTPVETNQYDPAGNRISIVRPGGTIAASYDVRDRLVKWGAVQYAWTPDGHLSKRADSRGSSSFAYDDFGSLRHATLADGRTISYVLDADGRRLARMVADKVVEAYLYNLNGTIAGELDPAGNLVARFAYDDLRHLALCQRAGVTYRVITDPLGSPRLVIDSRTGALADAITYDAWGNVTQETAPGFIPIGFAGGLRDPDTGLLRFGARDYDPDVGRWTAADPIRFNGRDANLYRYVHDNPINGRDTSGLDPYLGSSGPAAPWPFNDNGASLNAPSALMGGITLSVSDALFDGYTAGVNLQWIEGSGPHLYYYKGSVAGTDIGLAVSGNVGVIRNPSSDPSKDWQGPTTSVGGGAGQYNGGAYWSPDSEDPLAPSYFGLSGGVGVGGPFSGGTSNTTTGSWGDPHLHAPEGLHFDLQEAGELLVASSPDGQFIVQTRQEVRQESSAVTFNTAVAANVAGDRVGVYAKEPSFLMINNAAVSDLDLQKRLPHGGTLERHGGMVHIVWPDGSRLTVTQIANTLNYDFIPSTTLAQNLRGLLGAAGYNPPHDLMGRDGTLLHHDDPDFQSKLYRQFGNSWRIEQSESLFHYWPGESTAYFTDLNIPNKVATTTLSADARARAESICRALGVHTKPALDDCILDVAVTGQPAYAVATASFAAARPPETASAANASRSVSPAVAASPASPANAPSSANAPPPSSSISGQYVIKLGDTVSPDHPVPGAGSISKLGEQQSYSFTAPAGAIVFVKAGPCDGGAVSLEMRSPDNTSIAAIGCSDFGPINLPKAGTYQILARTDRSTAHYTFSLLSTTFDKYNIRLGDTVSPDHPVPGAGSISKLGEQQSYSFSGQANQIVWLGFNQCNGSLDLKFQLLGPNGGALFDAFCGDGPGRRQILPEAGTYQIVARRQGTAPYSFEIHAVPADQHAAVKLPFSIAPGSPAKWAGHIATVGTQQLYDFTGTPGSVVHIESSCSCANLWILVASQGDRFSYYDLKSWSKWDWTLPPGGKYTIAAFSEGYTGDYSFTAAISQPPRP
jgi:RHS repeat-associated protein